MKHFIPSKETVALEIFGFNPIHKRESCYSLQNPCQKFGVKETSCDSLEAYSRRETLLPGVTIFRVVACRAEQFMHSSFKASITSSIQRPFPDFKQRQIRDFFYQQRVPFFRLEAVLDYPVKGQPNQRIVVPTRKQIFRRPNLNSKDSHNHEILKPVVVGGRDRFARGIPCLNHDILHILEVHSLQPLVLFTNDRFESTFHLVGDRVKS
mmetsp:Transcript_6556/g.7595  ORF Transcript_6556/g.7595 Transcript_6556/m.7595 type:complete len:209 (-) Transcript_6556:37-663(-)